MQVPYWLRGETCLVSVMWEIHVVIYTVEDMGVNDGYDINN